MAQKEWTRWLRLDRLVPFLTLFGAGLLGTLALLGKIQVDLAHGAIITILVLLASDALVARIGVLERIEEKLPSSKASTTLRPHSLIVKTSEQAATAREICICGIHNSLAIVPHEGFLKARLKDEMKIKVVLLDPSSDNTRVWDRITNKEPGSTSRQIESSLSVLRVLDSALGGLIQVRLVDIILPFSIFGVDLERPWGSITVEYQFFGVATDQRPHIRMSRNGRDEWYEFYKSQFDLVFKDGRSVIGDSSQREIA